MSDINFCRGNKVSVVGGVAEIALNISRDFPFKVADVVIRYEPGENTVSIDDCRIPEYIRQNMLRFFEGDIEEYVRFLEDNLECLFGGGVPECVGPGGGTGRPEAEATGESGGGDVAEAAMLRRIDRHVNLLEGHRGSLNVTLEAHISNVSFLVCKKMLVKAACERCESILSLEASGSCGKCRGSVAFDYRYAVCSGFLGKLSLSGAKFACFDAITYQFGCLECGTAYEMVQGPKADVAFRCHKCLETVRIRVAKVCYKKKETAEQIKPGELPDRGTCRHYRKSTRWFRFPCCNRCFPCDECHNEAVGHRAAAASRMVCGLCGKEQPLKSACSCGMNMERKSTAFWEGGKGTRDRTRMSKKDRRKYRR